MSTPPPIITNPINDVTVLQNTANTNLDLLTNFDDPLTTGKVATFELYNPDLAGGMINVLLFDQADAGAPLTVENFRNYVDDNDYVNSIIHRSVPDFVLQGGGFTVENFTLDLVPDDPPILNEFSSGRSNLRGTIAMAKLGGDPDSATNQWFFNLADNSANLDNQNGGFTVFGNVLSDNDLAVLDEIASIPIFNGTSIHPAFTDLPLQIDPNNPVITSDDDFIRFRQITVSDVNELNFSVINNTNTDLVDVIIDNNQLTLDYFEDQIGTAEITIRGTNLLGQSVEDTFIVNVNEASPRVPEPSLNIGLFLIGFLAFLRPLMSRKKAQSR
ncbi:MAG: peptidylprolyl isomerase [Crocosphaera sp.]|nr:peptidylprolyl isomerase [Crocosphaera sp.]